MYHATLTCLHLLHPNGDEKTASHKCCVPCLGYSKCQLVHFSSINILLKTNISQNYESTFERTFKSSLNAMYLGYEV